MLNWFTRPTEVEDEAIPEPEDGTAGKLARRALLDQIAEFLLTHELDTSPANFALAHAAFAGTDLELAGKITARQISGESIDQAWLDGLVSQPDGSSGRDRVIQSVGEVLLRISNDKCHVARHGGEEFVLLFRGLTVAQAHDILDKARASLAQRNFINRATDQPIGQVTFSGGIADVFAFPDTREALRAADQALYRAKNEGRNRICLA